MLIIKKSCRVVDDDSYDDNFVYGAFALIITIPEFSHKW